MRASSLRLPLNTRSEMIPESPLETAPTIEFSVMIHAAVSVAYPFLTSRKKMPQSMIA